MTQRKSGMGIENAGIVGLARVLAGSDDEAIRLLWKRRDELQEELKACEEALRALTGSDRLYPPDRLSSNGKRPRRSRSNEKWRDGIPGTGTLARFIVGFLFGRQKAGYSAQVGTIEAAARDAVSAGIVPEHKTESVQSSLHNYNLFERVGDVRIGPLQIWRIKPDQVARVKVNMEAGR